MSRPCRHEDHGRPCTTAAGVRDYLIGPRCPRHTPAAVAGRPEAIVDPELTLTALRARAGLTASYRPTDSALVDQRAIVSGKRRSNPDIYRAALAAGTRARMSTLPDNTEPPPPAEAPAELNLEPPAIVCPGCRRHPAEHGRDCPLGPRARFAMAADGRMLGTAQRGPE